MSEALMRNDPAAPMAPAPDVAPLLVGEREARRLLGGLCAKTMYNLRRSGSLPFRKIGSRVMYRTSDLITFVERGRSREQT